MPEGFHARFPVSGKKQVLKAGKSGRVFSRCFAARGIRLGLKKWLRLTKLLATREKKPLGPRVMAAHPASKAWWEEKEALPESRQTFEVAGAQTSELFNLVLSRQTGLFECKLLFIDKPMVITNPAVASTQLLGMGSELYSSNMPRMLNKDLTRFMQSLSRERQNRTSKRKKWRPRDV